MNSMRGAIPFEADGESYDLRYSTNAQVRYQDKAGQPFLDDVMAMQGSGTNMSRLRRVFWAGLSHMPEMTEDMAGDIIDAIGVGEVGALIGRAVEAAFSPAKASAEGNWAKGKASPKEKPPTT